MKNEGDDTFLRITQRDVYNKVEKIESLLMAFDERNRKEHEEMVAHVIRTNGKVKLNRWIATTAMSLVIAVILILVRGGV